MTAGIYIRKSREDAEGVAYRLEAQREQLPAHARAQSWEPVVYDEGFASAAQGCRLPQRDRLEAAIRAGRIQVVLCIELSRLSRDATLEDYVRWLGLCGEHGTRLATPSRVLDPTQPSDWLLLLLEGGFSSVEMKVLHARMAEGRARAWEAGAYIGGGIPAGYRLDNGRIVVVEHEAEQVRRALEVFAATAVLRQAALASGIPYHRMRACVEEGCLAWWTATRESRQHPGETVRCQWEPIITADLADRVRAARGRVRVHRARIRSNYLLTGLGLLRCGYCDGPVKARRSGNRVAHHYACYDSSRGSWGCPESRGIYGAELEHKVVQHTGGVLRRVDDLRAYYRDTCPDESGQDWAAAEADLVAQRKRLVEALGLGAVQLHEAKPRLDELRADLDRIAAARSEAQRAAHQAPDWDTLGNLADHWHALDSDDLREALGHLLVRIRIYQRYATLEYRVPLSRTGRTTARIHLEPPQPGRRRARDWNTNENKPFPGGARSPKRA